MLPWKHGTLACEQGTEVMPQPAANAGAASEFKRSSSGSPTCASAVIRRMKEAAAAALCLQWQQQHAVTPTLTLNSEASRQQVGRPDRSLPAELTGA